MVHFNRPKKSPVRIPTGLSVESGVLGQLGGKPVMNICANVPALQQEVFVAAWNVRYKQQSHPSFFGQASPFAMVAASASSDQVHPSVRATTRLWDDVFGLKIAPVVAVSAVRAGMPVTGKELAACDGWHYVEQVHSRLATHGNDWSYVEDGLSLRGGIEAASEGCQRRLANTPRDRICGVVEGGFFWGDPGLRCTLDVQLEDLRGVHWNLLRMGHTQGQTRPQDQPSTHNTCLRV